MPKKNSKTIYIAALLLFVGGVGYLLFSGLSQNSVYFLNVSEALAMPSGDLKSARLFGTVKAEGLQRIDEGLGVRFQIEDKDNKTRTMWVEYKGAVPDTFKPGAEVIIEGGVAPQTQMFAARTLMTKCPSKYQKENRE
ncbi:cytochrome c biogenesis protein CcmE [Oleidesulfovibrio alaskensis G20]|jgi:cytochrome c-type biogenesis protein CcmE|uniref:Cytochrome c biogenesis protein CcmE n=1 Tax=Oleidesulfovibrio alaskensis (strain ATCC BAA-1058 / DSM 17464 / G20) TaxID=207559 RepID=Q311W9_OLEA2|nr:cytochrome c maturation protein CcmE [Oleidesulfovibrio alaskensis]ABB38277.1 cytochrome c biogenesis protein CcmE [Oleidesulfovibrio alaskensis G20]MBG0774322.1 cytochrome c maturation protein CcmE [Oleidesulfovibrio alaskensis]MBL3581216.1 cytochrome c maturation protein CcmE [Oleidesulfovibrio alaskensis]